MNKQELKKIVRRRLKSQRPYTTKYSEGKVYAYKTVLGLLERLDEPQKPKTEVFNHDEKFVIEWLDHTTGYHYSLYNAINDAGSEVRSWMKIGFNSNRFARALMSMDYEVEKEPLYYIKLPGGKNYDMFVSDRDGNLKVFLNGIPETQYTEQQIKAIDERYWAFAVPVEEVSEKHEI